MAALSGYWLFKLSAVMQHNPRHHSQPDRACLSDAIFCCTYETDSRLCLPFTFRYMTSHYVNSRSYTEASSMKNRLPDRVCMGEFRLDAYEASKPG